MLGQRVPGTSATGALARVWAWQLWRRTARRPVLIRCAEGSQLVAPSWSRGSSVIAATGLAERNDAIFVLDLLRAGDIFVDVGANIGFYTVLAARRGATVEAFEPTPEAAATCERSIALNSVQSLAHVHRAACGAATGTVRFTTGLDISNHIVEGDAPGIEVTITTLDDELADRDAPVCMFKVDAEGHDLDVLRGGLGAIARLQPVILVEIWTGGAGPLELVAPHGYRPYRYDPRSRRLSEIALDRPRGGNLLMIPDAKIDEVRTRLQSAPVLALRAPSVRWLGG